MTPEFEALKSNRAVVVSVIAAAISVTILCLVGIALMLGWVGGPRAPIAPVIVSIPKAKTPAPPAVALVPGETLVTPAEPDPPRASPPAAPAAPAAAPPPRTRPEPAPRPRPATPSYARPGESRSPPARKLVCRTCGTVTAIATFPDLWEVRVRLEDGASFSVRYPSPPTLRVGDRVRLANGRLERE